MFSKHAFKFIGILGLALTSPRSLASDIPCLGVNLCTLHYSKVAYGKSVKSVVAHGGMYRDCTQFDGSDPYWADVKDEPLVFASQSGNFGAKTVIFDRGSTYQPCKTQPIVQYWVTFEDGTTKIEAPVKVDITSTYFFSDERENLQVEEFIADFDTLEAKDITTTACAEFNSYGDLALDLVKSYAPTLHVEDR